MSKLLRRSIPLVVVLLAAGCVNASAAGTKKAAVGDYQAAPIIPADQDYSVGVFSVEKAGGKRRIVRTEEFTGIYYPDSNECDDYDLPLATDVIPIGADGRFRWSEKTPVEDTVVKVTWKGRWTKPGVVAGSITIKHEGCTATRKWSGGKVTAPIA